MYIGDYWNFDVKHFSTSGAYLGSFADSTKGNAPGKHLSPYGLAVYPQGNVYFGNVDSNSTIDKYDAINAKLVTGHIDTTRLATCTP